MLKLVGIGALGNMLHPAANHLTKGNPVGQFLRVYDRQRAHDGKEQRRAAWRAHGAKLVSTYEDLITSEEIDGVIICAGKNGDDLEILAQIIPLIIQRYPTGRRPFILHCSTVSVGFVSMAYEACHQHDIHYANYPLTGGAKGAAMGTMLILASGSKAFFNRIQPLLEVLGQPKFFDEQVETAARVKFISHVMVFNALLGISSAISLQTKGLPLNSHDQTEFFNFVNQGAGGVKQWELTLKQAIELGNWETGFLLQHAVIDAIYAADELIKAQQPTITILPILQIATAFSFLLQRYPNQQMATQTILKALCETPTELEAFVKQHQDFDVAKYLNNIIRSLTPELRWKVSLEIPSPPWGEGTKNYTF